MEYLSGILDGSFRILAGEIVLWTAHVKAVGMARQDVEAIQPDCPLDQVLV
jgi:hypothetical protein